MKNSMKVLELPLAYLFVDIEREILVVLPIQN